MNQISKIVIERKILSRMNNIIYVWIYVYPGDKHDERNIIFDYRYNNIQGIHTLQTIVSSEPTITEVVDSFLQEVG